MFLLKKKWCLAVSRQIGPSSLPDTRVTPYEQYGDRLWFLSGVLFCFLCLSTWPKSPVPLFWQWVSLCETPECVCGLENFTRTSINIVIGTKNMKCEFWASHPFNIRTQIQHEEQSTLLLPPASASCVCGTHRHAVRTALCYPKAQCGFVFHGHHSSVCPTVPCCHTPSLTHLPTLLQ